MRLLAAEALLTFDMAIRMVASIEAMPEGGDKAKRLTELNTVLAAYRPVLRAVIRAQEQAAEALDLAKGQSGPRLICGAFRNVPNPHPDAANPQAPSPQQPTPGVA